MNKLFGYDSRDKLGTWLDKVGIEKSLCIRSFISMSLDVDYYSLGRVCYMRYPLMPIQEDSNRSFLYKIRNNSAYEWDISLA